MFRRRLAGSVLSVVIVIQATAVAGADSTSESVTSTPLADIQAISQKIDAFIEAGYAAHEVKPNPPASHEAFLRRIYLGIVGRIPTYDETVAFQQLRDAGKRTALIDTLLDSEGYVSHHYNFWADVLRVKSRLNRVPGQPYIEWVKDALRANMPYDQFVYELLTAEGYIWEHGAAGYYQRDFAMPLDNMSNTTRIFLGTRLGCAQCHDHPFDVWTQHDYYQMAAFTFGVQTQKRRKDLEGNLKQFARLLQKEDKATKRAGQRMIDPLRYVVYERDRPLRLPDNYEYDDAAPKSVVEPKTIFGEDAVPARGESERVAYARWLTSPDNPHFTMVIANRLWKLVMGVGLIEPVDDVQEGYDQASNPALLKYLTEQMVALDYDMKQYLRALYNTQTYRRQVSRDAWKPGEPYHFPGPVLRRMTAEQLWDSLLTLAVEDLDERQGRVRQRWDAGGLEELKAMKPQQLLAMARERGAETKRAKEARKQRRQLTKQIQTAKKANDKSRVMALQKQQKSLKKPKGRRRMSMSDVMTEAPKGQDESKWKGFPADMVRASELPSPAPNGHFLRRFGQSDRELVENASDEATVPQILNMLNGPLFSKLMKAKSVLARQVREQNSTRGKLEVIFQSIYNRRPTSDEMRLAVAHAKSGGEGFENVVWALLNTRQFMFIE